MLLRPPHILNVPLTAKQEALRTSMTNEQWHTAVNPKVEGTWNIHNALLGKDAELDFFLMTSSISGGVGTATEANYCAGNYFLDLFARTLSSCYRVISSR